MFGNFLGAIGGGVSGLMGGGQDPASGMLGGILSLGNARQSRKEAKHAQMRNEAHAGAMRNLAMQELDKVPGVANQHFNPYIQQGNEAQNRATGVYNRMTENPMDFLNQIVSGYRPSQGYQFREGRALEAARNSAAQGGLTGTRNDQAERAQLVNDIMGADIQQYLGNVLGIQGSGLQGQQHLADRGYNASQNLSDVLTNALSERAGIYNDRALGYEGQAVQNQRNRMEAGRAQRQATSGLINQAHSYAASGFVPGGMQGLQSSIGGFARGLGGGGGMGGGMGGMGDMGGMGSPYGGFR
jgi:hypothetical protein